jgi:hypothetical protein
MTKVAQTARCNIPEDSHLHTRRLDNLTAHLIRDCLKLSHPKRLHGV